MMTNMSRARLGRMGWTMVAGVSVGFGAVLAGCAGGKSEEPAKTKPGAAGPAFASPEAAVPAINDMIRRADWVTLTSYYDLTLTRQIRKEELLSGRYFVDEAASATSGPTAVTRYRQPFPPGSKFVSARAEGDPETLPCIYTVVTVREIEQGGGLVQRIMSESRMIRSTDGYRLLALARVR